MLTKIGTILLLLVILGGVRHCVDAQTPEPVPGGKRPSVGPERQNKSESTATSNQKEIEDSDVVRIDTTLINVPVRVMDRDGKFIPRLGRQDFRIFEDGEERAIASFSPVEAPFTVILLLDVSPSTKFRLKDIQEAAIAFIDQLRAEDHVYVIAFSCFTQLMADGSNNRDSIRDAIRRLRTGIATCLYSTVNFTIKEVLQQIPGRKAVVLFTDGVDDRQPPLDALSFAYDATYKSTVYDAEELDALIYPIQYDTTAELIRQFPELHNQISRDAEVAKAYLRDLAQKTGARVYQADNMENLNRAFALVAEELRNQYSLSFYLKTSTQPGQRHTINVVVSRPDAVVRARSNYLSPTPPQATGRSLMLTIAARRPGVILLHYYVTGPKRDWLLDENLIRGRRQAFAVVKNGSEKTVQAIGWEISIIDWSDKRVLKTIRFNSKLRILPEETKRLDSEFNNIRDKITYRIQLVEIKYSDGSVWKRS